MLMIVSQDIDLNVPYCIELRTEDLRPPCNALQHTSASKRQKPRNRARNRKRMKHSPRNTDSSAAGTETVRSMCVGSPATF